MMFGLRLVISILSSSLLFFCLPLFKQRFKSRRVILLDLSLMAPRKVLILLVDGIGDTAIPELGYQTPLLYADTPCLDMCAGTFQTFTSNAMSNL